MAHFPAPFIKKSHEIVFSQLSLSPVEHDIFAMFLKRLGLDSKSDYFNLIDDEYVHNGKRAEYVFNSTEIEEWFGISNKRFKSVLFQPCNRLASKKIGLSDKDSFDFIPLFKRIKYDRGTLTVVPNDELLLAYFGGSLGHSQVSQLEFRQMKLESSKRLYSILSRFKTKGKVPAKSLIELYGYFGLLDESGNLSKKTYEKTTIFIDRIIKPAIKEVSECDQNIGFYSSKEQPKNFGYKLIKSGRKIEKIEFLYNWDIPSHKTELAEELSPLEMATVVYCKINNDESVSKDEIELLKENLMTLQIEEGFELTGKVISAIQSLKS
ncbi:replication initiation protein [Aliivibrio salmonicida]|uniref:replication initiation protein n=1 Tax=Aliivibrio salmonicida TaxID=40269 RepID=UPI003D0CE755